MKATFLSSLSGAIRNALIVMAGLTMLMTFTSPAAASPIHFGVRCEGTFQNNWNPAIDVYNACSDFINTSARYDYIDFYFNLVGAQPAFYYGNGAETCNPCGGVDSVDFFFMATHGGIASNNPYYASYAMWDAYIGAWINDMRLGDSGQQLKVFATLACDTFKNNDGLFWNRWGNAYRGGLKIGVGGHDLLYTNNDTQGMSDFAQYMHNGTTPIGWAWLDAVYYALTYNHPTVANTGVNSADCWNRQGLDITNVIGAPTLRDGAIGYACWTNWN